MATLRVRRAATFAVAVQHSLNDVDLSWGARGVMAYLLMQEDNWQCDLEAFVADHGSTPKAEVWEILKELGDRQYLVKNIDRFGNIEYVVWADAFTVPKAGERIASLRVEELAKVIKAYPDHRKPHGAPQAVSVAQAWNEIVASPDAPTLEEIVLDLAKRKRSHDWTKEEGRYVPSLHSYIERRMWTFPIHPDPPKDRRDFNSGGSGDLVL